ncbi:dephospho-CoA kinase [Anaerococcus senegalensis]|uniref:dephospho-CoA kinase n=1 Tax=Anaerococcus senegalensis TaxID=1288120 RepID=UPI0003060FA7|nr:dephospho-CoA kinase [Anaerococcus senegalensis]
MNQNRIVITGTISSGKSSLSDILRKKGYFVIDSDKINAKLLEKDQINYREILSSGAFNEAFEDGIINKRILGEIIFNDPKKRELINKISHKNIISYINKEIENSKEKNVFIEIPLYFQMKEKFPCEYVWLVTTNKDVQIKRLMNRDKIDKDFAIKKINSQNFSLMKEKSDLIFDNSTSLDDLEKKVDIALDNLEKK